ncbi:MAG: hypothetical protein IPH37_16795 [Burkholderiales bacterium]|nr:hypothetical protein [Burkholderiales bacterium]
MTTGRGELHGFSHTLLSATIFQSPPPQPAPHHGPSTRHTPRPFHPPPDAGPAQHPRGQAHLSAASGLVRVRQHLYVVADDELHLGVFEDPTHWPVGGATPPPGTLVRLLEGIAASTKANARPSPTWRPWAHLPPSPGCPAGASAWLGSLQASAKPACWRRWTHAPVPNGRMATVDLGPWYLPAASVLPT